RVPAVLARSPSDVERGATVLTLRPAAACEQFHPHKEVEMRSPLRRPSAALVWSVGLLLCGASVAAAQGTGTIRGTVTDAGNKRPVDAVQVFVARTDFATLTNAAGEYQLNLPAGDAEVRMGGVGFGRA